MDGQPWKQGRKQIESAQLALENARCRCSGRAQDKSRVNLRGSAEWRRHRCLRNPVTTTHLATHTLGSLHDKALSWQTQIETPMRVMKQCRYLACVYIYIYIYNSLTTKYADVKRLNPPPQKRGLTRKQAKSSLHMAVPRPLVLGAYVGHPSQVHSVHK